MGCFLAVQGGNAVRRRRRGVAARRGVAGDRRPPHPVGAGLAQPARSVAAGPGPHRRRPGLRGGARRPPHPGRPGPRQPAGVLGRAGRPRPVDAGDRVPHRRAGRPRRVAQHRRRPDPGHRRHRGSGRDHVPLAASWARARPRPSSATWSTWSNVGGEDCAALGSDWDGLIVTPRDMRTVAELPVLLAGHAGPGLLRRPGAPRSSAPTTSGWWRPSAADRRRRSIRPRPVVRTVAERRDVPGVRPAW